MAVSVVQLKISDAEYQVRCDQLLEHIQSENLSGVVLFDNYYILYYTGFAFIPTERPMAFVMNSKGERGLFVPRLEVEHAQANALIDRVDHYKEYPDKPHPMEVFAQMLKDMGVDEKIGADTDGYPWILGYRGPAMSEFMNTTVTPVRVFVEDQMALKSPAELALIMESVRWGNLAHMLLQRYTKVGVTETEVSQRACNEATLAMLDAIGPIYRSQNPLFDDGAMADYRGQIGRNSVIPHALANNIVFQAGDLLVTGATAPVWGYLSELERTMVIGEPSDDIKRFFDHMVALQDTAFEVMKPGRLCSDVDTAVRAYFEKHDLTQYWKHHTGHCIGLRYHEGPFLDIGDDTELQPGMVFTVEPGIYVPELGGFRHSDTVVITEDGVESMTYYPRDLESLTLPV
jgi:Xaa-Pro dipeptidase